MDNYSDKAGRANETNKSNGEGEGWDESSGNREGRHKAYWDKFGMVLCNYVVSGSRFPVKNPSFAQIR